MTRAFAPTSLAEAVRILGDAELGAVPVAGCTDLLVVDHATGRRHGAVVDLNRLPELRGIQVKDCHLDIGAAETFSAIRASDLVRAHAPILAEIAGTVGAWQIQNRATVGGNIANASPAGDSLPVLLALGAELVLHGPAGRRALPYQEMHVSYRKTALSPGELIERVRIPLPAVGAFTAVKKVGTREAQAISKVLVAFHAAPGEGGTLKAVRIGAGSVAAIPIRLGRVEALLEGQVMSPALAEEAAELARAEVTPIDDVRSSAPYRHFALGRVVWRMALCAGRHLGGGQA